MIQRGVAVFAWILAVRIVYKGTGEWMEFVAGMGLCILGSIMWTAADFWTAMLANRRILDDDDYVRTLRQKLDR